MQESAKLVAAPRHCSVSALAPFVLLGLSRAVQNERLLDAVHGCSSPAIGERRGNKGIKMMELRALCQRFNHGWEAKCIGLCLACYVHVSQRACSWQGQVSALSCFPCRDRAAEKPGMMRCVLPRGVKHRVWAPWDLPGEPLAAWCWALEGQCASTRGAKGPPRFLAATGGGGVGEILAWSCSLRGIPATSGPREIERRGEWQLGVEAWSLSLAQGCGAGAASGWVQGEAVRAILFASRTRDLISP